jgi:hypothetical protein
VKTISCHSFAWQLNNMKTWCTDTTYKQEKEKLHQWKKILNQHRPQLSQPPSFHQVLDGPVRAMPLPDRQPDNRTSATSLTIARGTKAPHLDGGDTRGTETTWQPGGHTTHDSIHVKVKSDHPSDRQGDKKPESNFWEQLPTRQCLIWSIQSEWNILDCSKKTDSPSVQGTH